MHRPYMREWIPRRPLITVIMISFVSQLKRMVGIMEITAKHHPTKVSKKAYKVYIPSKAHLDIRVSIQISVSYRVRGFWLNDSAGTRSI